MMVNSERFSFFFARMRSIRMLFCLICLIACKSAESRAFTADLDSFVLAQDTLQFDPREVMIKSLIVPGWGQVQNQQAWKIPIIYGAFAGGGLYLSDLTKRYHDYRAAVYNISRGSDSDLRFGRTPSYIPENANLTELQRLRDSYRNKRDFAFLILGILYGLNVLDAYVYAHMSTFDVSDDLRASVMLTPIESYTLYANPIASQMISPGIRVRITLR